MLNGKNILITGGTGSFGTAFVDYVLENFSPSKLVVFSRDEMKQWSMRERLGDHPCLRFLLGDVRDKDRLKRAFSGIDIVLHAAATKIVPVAEYESFECVKTNVFGAMNVIDAAIDCGVSKVVALSTDKASAPVNLYGATKLTSDRLFVSARHYAGNKSNPIFSVVRYGNVMGSRGSVIPLFLNLKKESRSLPITDENMTRFMITLDEAVELVMTALEKGKGGEIFVKKIPSMKVVDIADAIAPGLQRKIVGIRPGEKLHEQMIGTEDASTTLEYAGYFKIRPFDADPLENDEGKPLPNDFVYSSGNNKDWMTKQELLDWVENAKMLDI